MKFLRYVPIGFFWVPVALLARPAQAPIAPTGISLVTQPHLPVPPLPPSPPIIISQGGPIIVDGPSIPTKEKEEEDMPREEYVNISVALMLLGAMTFQMGLFYMLNHSDPDIKKTSWNVISTTISIFVAVLSFHAVSGLLEKAIEVYTPEESIEMVSVVVEFLHFTFWFVVLHMFIAREATNKGERTQLATSQMNFASEMKEHEEADEKEEEEHEQRMMCGVSLLAHICAFAAIHFGATLQHLPWFSGHAATTLIPVELLMMVEMVFFRISDVIRNVPGMASEEELETWDEEAEEAENDIAFLSLSFLSVSSLRFQISGVLPTAHGTEEPALVHPAWCTQVLFAFGIAFGLLTSLLVKIIAMREVAKKIARLRAESGFSEDGAPFSSRMVSARGSRLTVGQDLDEDELHERCKVSIDDIQHKSTKGLDPLSSYGLRWWKMVPSISAIAAAWCFLYAVKWESMRLPSVANMNFGPDSTTQCVVLALVVSIGSFVIIFGLDKIADAKCSDQIVDVIVRTIISGFAVLVGFSWENAFAGGLEDISKNLFEEGHSEWFPAFCQMAMAGVVCIIVIPAWRWYILKVVLKLDKLEKAGHEHHSDEGDISDADLHVGHIH